MLFLIDWLFHVIDYFRYFDSDAGTVSWVGSVLCGVYLMSGQDSRNTWWYEKVLFREISHFLRRSLRMQNLKCFAKKKIKTWLWNTFSPTCFEARTQNEFRLSIFKTGSMMVMLLEGVEHAKQQTRSRISRFRKTTLFTKYKTCFVWISLEILTKQTRNTIGFTVAENF